MPKAGLEKTQSLPSVTSAASTRPDHSNSAGNLLRRTASTSVATNWRTEELPLYAYKDLEHAYVTARGKRISPALVAVGFDMEWVISMMSGSRGKKTAVVQVADDKMILVLHLHKMQAFPSKLKELVESPEILKLGVNIVQDYAKLIKDFGVSPRMGVELRDIANIADRSIMAAHGIPEHEQRVKFSLLVRIFMHKELDKGPVKLGNWEKYPLSETQINYAANDAHCGFILYKRLMSMAASQDITVDFDELAQRVNVVAKDYP
ncbi:hypothetical protein FRC04_009760 [Tulasnella sp. 424]|nr:hypothetical protein FRC04_009760 [Tulasnella sp. 424]KAG8963122.1 hypothetical protein FRC05_004921 [Tulasnella sp. 425]